MRRHHNLTLNVRYATDVFSPEGCYTGNYPRWARFWRLLTTVVELHHILFEFGKSASLKIGIFVS